MSALSRFLPAIPPAPPLTLARGEVFFVRRVPLAAGEPTAPQVALALEGMAPFPPEQLYYGHVVAEGGADALVFAAFRRRFTAEETEGWEGAALVTAEFLPLLAAGPEKGDGVALHTGERRVTALAWRSGDALPVAVLCREGGEAEADFVRAELLERAGLASDTPTRRLAGALALGAGGEAGGLKARAGDEELGGLAEGWATTADVRDPEFLLARRRAEIRDVWLWRGLLGVAALLVLSAVIDVGAGVLGFMAGKSKAQVTAQAEPVRQTETAQALANRIAELSEKRLMPFEMMALINPARPDAVVFQRAVTRGLLKIEIEAQAANAEDVGKYANALKATPGIASAAARDIRARDGVTSFILDVEFKAEALRNGVLPEAAGGEATVEPSVATKADGEDKS